uniref:Adenylate kinase 7a n=1 Tax=Callorhinchus milii TaxID=7868 RepID=A0A4W3JD38_CALMI
MEEPDDGQKEIVRSKRIFLNQLDTFVGKYVGKYLAQCVVGSSSEEVDQEEEEEETSTILSGSLGRGKEGTYQVVGTLKNRNDKGPDFAFEICSFVSREELLLFLLECDIIIYNIIENTDQIDEASWAASALHSEMDRFEAPKMFILLSTIMTWSHTKPLDADDPSVPFTEDDYRRRKAHPNFKDHLSIEKLVIKLGKTKKRKFNTYVVASGLHYGMEETVFHTFFKMAWLGDVPAVPYFGDGLNIVPCIHIRDLAAVLQNVADQKPKIHYLIAVDDSKNSLQSIIKAISKLGSGKVEMVPEENALLNKDLQQSNIDHLLINLPLEAFYIKENFNIRWEAENGLVDNMQKMIQEFKESRGLLPLKIAIVGPPGVGKTAMAEKLSKHFKLHHIKIKDVILESEEKIGRVDTEEEEEEEEEITSKEAQELLDQIRENMEQSEGRLDDHFVIRFMKEKLKSMQCQNQGFILDGFPKSYLQTKDLFGSECGGIEEENSRTKLNKSLTAEHIFALDASDDFLKNRIMNLAESEVAGTHYTQEKFLRHLAKYRDTNTEDETLLNFFEEIEVHPVHIDITKDTDPSNTALVEKITSLVGKTRNYGPTPEELAEIERKQAKEQLLKEVTERAERERREAEESAEKLARWEEWNKRLEDVKREEHEFLEAHSIPLRNYLMQNVMPTLTQGLIECCKIRPEDPVDFLAEYLLKNNPQIE